MFSLWPNISPVHPEHHPVCGPQIPAGHVTQHRAAVQGPWQQSIGERPSLMILVWSIKCFNVQCCSVNGCNWNEAHALAGTNPGADSSALGTSDVVVTAVAGILLGFVVLIFCLFILFITLCRKKDEEEVKYFWLNWKNLTKTTNSGVWDKALFSKEHIW